MNLILTMYPFYVTRVELGHIRNYLLQNDAMKWPQIFYPDFVIHIPYVNSNDVGPSQFFDVADITFKINHRFP